MRQGSEASGLLRSPWWLLSPVAASPVQRAAPGPSTAGPLVHCCSWCPPGAGALTATGGPSRSHPAAACSRPATHKEGVHNPTLNHSMVALGTCGRQCVQAVCIGLPLVAVVGGTFAKHDTVCIARHTAQCVVQVRSSRRPNQHSTSQAAAPHPSTTTGAQQEHSRSTIAQQRSAAGQQRPTSKHSQTVVSQPCCRLRSLSLKAL